MSAILILVYAVTMTCIVFGALHFNNIQAKKKLLRPIDDGKLCQGPHSWEEAAFMSHAEYEEVKNKPDAPLKKKNFCIDCGLIAGSEQMLNPSALRELQDKFERAEISRQFKLDILQMEGEWINEYLNKNNTYTPDQAEHLKQGFRLYASFLDNLPALVMARAMDKQYLKFIQEIEDNSNADLN